MPQYQPLPVPPDQNPGEPIDHYGARLLAWLLQTDGCTATLSDDALELACYAGVGASARATDPAVLQALTDLRHWLEVARHHRTVAKTVQDTIARSQMPAAAQGADRPNEGPMAPLVPRPRVNPPAGSYARVGPQDDIAF